MCPCMGVSLCASLNVYVRVCLCVLLSNSTHTSLGIFMLTGEYGCVYVRACVCFCEFVRMCVCVHLCVSLCV